METKLYAMDIRPWALGKWQELVPFVPEERRARAQQCRRQEDAARLICAGYLLQKVLETMGVARQTQVFATTELGKPYLRNHRNIHFSISHSGHWVLCAVGDHPLGVDVELPRLTRDVAERFFSQQELQIPDSWLPRLWTAKEAYLKAMGTGLTVPLDSCPVVLTEQTAMLRQTLYKLYEYTMEEYHICLCTLGSKPVLTLFDGKDDAL